jgi:hypothetical protein
MSRSELRISLEEAAKDLDSVGKGRRTSSQRTISARVLLLQYEEYRNCELLPKMTGKELSDSFPSQTQTNNHNTGQQQTTRKASSLEAGLFFSED